MHTMTTVEQAVEGPQHVSYRMAVQTLIVGLLSIPVFVGLVVFPLGLILWGLTFTQNRMNDTDFARRAGITRKQAKARATKVRSYKDLKPKPA